MLQRIIVVSLLAATVIAGGTVLAQQTAPAAKPASQAVPTPMTVEKIKENLYWFKGGVMANAGFYVGPDGVIVIDAKMTPDGAREMLAGIKTVTDKPVFLIILTHSDGDHVNGLTAFPKGLKILSSAATKSEMEEAFKDEKMADLRVYLPNQVFTKTFSLQAGNDLIDLIPLGPAHTGGDTIVYFHSQKAVFVGDLVFLGRDPIVHRQKSGTSFGLVKALQAILALDADVFISGHNDPLTKSDIQGELKMIQEKQAKVKELMDAGKALDEIKAAMGVQTPPNNRWPSLVEVIYLDLKEKRF
jgi:cyclase